MIKTTKALPKCFKDFFKFQDECAAASPKSGLCFDLLPGISRDVVAAWCDPGKHENANEFVNTCLIRALSIVKRKVKGSLSAMNVEMNHEPEKVEACDMSNRIACPGGWRGVRVSAKTLQSKFACIRVNRISVKTCKAETITLQIRNDKYQVIYSQELTTMAGNRTHIEIDEAFDTKIVYIGFDQTGIGVFESDCARGGGCCLSQKSHGKSRFLVDGWDGTYTGAEQVNSYGFGVTACVSLECKFDNIVCCFKNELKDAILYATGVEMLEEAKASRRITPETVFLGGTVDETIAKWSFECDQFISCELGAIKSKLLRDKTCFACCNRTPGFIPTLS